MLLLVLCAMVGLSFIQVLYDDFRMLREWGAGLSDVARYVAITVPSFLTLVLPLSILVSLLFVLGKLHRANEFTALRAAGVGLARITAPIWVAGVAMCGLSYWLNTDVVPRSVEESQQWRDALSFRQQAKSASRDRVGAVFSVGFDNPAAKRTWFFNRYSQFTNRAYGVSVSVLDDQRRETVRILSSEAYFDVRQGWVFERGRELTFDPATGEQLTSVPFEQRVEPTFREDPKLMLLIDRKPSALSLPQLQRLVDYFALGNNDKGTPYAVRYHRLISDTAGPLIVIAIAIPFAMAGVRVNPVVGVSKSLGLFVLYYLFMITASALATKHLLSPQTAAWLPNGGMILLALWFFVRMR